MRFDLLCSGSKGNCCLIRHNGHSFLIDCGPSSKKYLKKALEDVGSSLEEIEAVLITHSHRDHTNQLPLFSHLPVYAYCELHMKDRNRQLIEFNRTRVWPQIPFPLFDLIITPIVLSHDSGPTVGYMVDDGQERLVYITDTGYLRNDLLDMLSDATYYIFESNHDVDMLMHCKRPMMVKQRILSDVGHLNNEDASRHLAMMAGEHTRQIVLAHLSQEANTPEQALFVLEKTFQARKVDYSHIVLQAAGQFEIISSIDPSSRSS